MHAHCALSARFLLVVGGRFIRTELRKVGHSRARSFDESELKRKDGKLARDRGWLHGE